MGRLRDKFTGTIRPAEGSTPVPLPDLRAALRALDVPFTVRAPRLDEKADLVAEWSTPHRVRLRIRMRFDAGRGEVRVLEERWERSGVLGNRRYGRGPGRPRPASAVRATPDSPGLVGATAPPRRTALR
ncbi:hypothetical protein [Streptomyces acidiscabies]|uniref:hypothetical protein n=1 Tax=Streptomyces acidiscabies TaxID=42234 RepID=UPI00096853C6|nr:hypothetical protein [Streptomyces acidiscabies]GAV45960.1 hypothetical protein Saa2_08960 [Streptomyces acidiscabies]